MPQFILKIDLGNDAMSFPADVAGALHFNANRIHADGLAEAWNNKINIHDINGNVVGHYEVTK